jgi:hypothetical protein
MNSSIRDQTEGKFHEAKGKVKEMAGEPTGNAKLEATGTSQINSRQRSACPWPRDCGCMTHNNHNSERQEVFGE